MHQPLTPVTPRWHGIAAAILVVTLALAGSIAAPDGASAGALRQGRRRLGVVDRRRRGDPPVHDLRGANQTWRLVEVGGRPDRHREQPGKTIVGVGTSGHIVGGGFFLGNGVHNVIVRNPYYPDPAAQLRQTGSIVVSSSGRQETRRSAFNPGDFYSYAVEPAADVPSLVGSYAAAHRPHRHLTRIPTPRCPGHGRPGTFHRARPAAARRGRQRVPGCPGRRR